MKFENESFGILGGRKSGSWVLGIRNDGGGSRIKGLGS
jgi:hypothetical protein